MTIVYIILFLFFVIIITRPFIVLFHELGHAIPALIFSREKVEIYLGSYGDKVKSFKIQLGLLEIWVKPAFFWKSGLCVYNKSMSIDHRIIVTFCGPIASFSLSFVLAYIIFAFEMHGSLKVMIACFLMVAFIDLIVNLSPSNKRIATDRGGHIYNDAYNLILLNYYKKFPAELEIAKALYLEEKYIEASSYFERFIDRELVNEDIYRADIFCLTQNQDYTKALLRTQEFRNKYNMTAADYSASAFLQIFFEKFEAAIKDFDAAIKLQPDIQAYSNRAFTMILNGQFVESIKEFDLIIEIEPSSSYAYANRGWAKMLSHKTDDGLSDIRQALEIDPDNAYAHRNMGIYHFQNKNIELARKHFDKAKKQGVYVYQIDDWIAKIS